MIPIIIPQEVPYHALKQLKIREWTQDERDSLVDLVDQHHYLQCPPALQRQLCQIVTWQEQCIAVLIWTNACYHLAGRDRYIGWDPRTRCRRLHFIVQNSRFLLLPKLRCPNLASKVLALSLGHLSDAWQNKFAIRPLLAESFVDPERFQGTCYKAAGWTSIGQTAGYSRYGSDYYQCNNRPKDLWLKPLSNDGLERLRNPTVQLDGEKQRAYNKMPLKAKQAESLVDALKAVEDHRTRRGLQFPLHAMLATSVVALCCGARTVSDIFRFCQDLSSPQRRLLGFRANPKARNVVPPPGEGCWRKVLKKLNPDSLAHILNAWQQSQRDELPEFMAIDGKVIGNNLATIVSLVDVEDGSPIAQAAAAGNGQEQALTKKLIADLPAGAIAQKVIMGDALYAQKQLVRTLVHEMGADVIVQVKNNQKRSCEQANQRLEKCAPLF